MNYSSVARKITAILFLTHSLGSAGFIAANTINTIVGAQLSGTPASAGVPSFIYQIGSALSAYVWGRAMDRIGRRGGIVLGLIVSVVGSGIAAIAVAAHSFLFFLVGMVLMGAGRAAIDLGRFAAAEIHPPAQRARAIANVVIGGTVGSVFGPLMVGVAGGYAIIFGFNELIGPYVFSLALFVIAALLVFGGLRPDPRDLAREFARQNISTAILDPRARTIAEILRDPSVALAMLVMMFGQMIMVMLMVITSLYMKDHQHALADISIVISSHTFGMYAFSILSGRLADHFGRRPVILAGTLTLALAGIFSTLSPDVLPLSFALFLLGLGWNFCYVGGSSLLADQLSIAERSRIQGFNDLLIGAVSAVGGLASGFIFAGIGYNAMGYVSALAALAPMTLAWRAWMNERKTIVGAWSN